MWSCKLAESFFARAKLFPIFLRDEWKADGDFQARQGIAGGESASVEFDGAAGDGESQADAAAGAAAVGIDAIEGIEDAGERILGNAGAAVANNDGGVRALGAEGDVDRGFRRGVADGVADDVFDGAAEELGVAGEIDAGVFDDVEG